MVNPEQVNALLWLVVAGIALVPTLIFYTSYRRVGSDRLLLTTGAFALFFIKALLLGLRLFVLHADDEVWYLDDDFWWSIAALLDIAIIGTIAYTLMKKT